MVIISEVKGIVSGGFDRFPDFLSFSACGFAEFTFLTPLSCVYIFFRLISVLQIMFYALLALALEGPSLKYSQNMLLTFTLCYDAGPDCLIRSIRIVCKYRKCIFLTGLIISLTDLLQTDHQGRKDTSKTKSTGSPVLHDSSISRSPNFFFCPRHEPVRWPKNSWNITRSLHQVLHWRARSMIKTLNSA